MIDLPGSKDTVLERHTGVTRVILRGDPRIAEAYLGRAQVYMGWLRNNLALGGITVGVRHLSLDNGVKIRTLFDGAMNIIEIYAPPVTGGEEAVRYALFLESAFLDIRPLGAAVIGGAPAGKVYYLQPQLNQIEEPLPWLDEVSTPPPPALLTGTPRFTLRDYTAGMASEGVPESSSKRHAYLVPSAPSAATGKLKLLLQSWLGSKRQGTALAAYSAPGSTNKTYALYTTPDLEYYLLTLTRTTIQATPLVLSGAGQWLRRTWLKVRDEREASETLKVEAYLLSTATVTESDPDEEDASTFQAAQFTAVQGETFYYGWKLNWDGSRGSLCTYEIGAEAVTSRRYAFAVVPAQDQPFRIDVSKVETVDWTPRNNADLIWVPFWILGAMMPIVWPRTWPALLAADAPVYSYYNSADELVLIRHAYTGTVGTIDAAQRAAVYSIFTCDLTPEEAEGEQFTTEVRAGFYTRIIPSPEGETGVPLVGFSAVDARGDQTSGVFDWVRVWGEILNPDASSLTCITPGYASPYQMCPGQTWTGGYTPEEEEYCNPGHFATTRLQHTHIGTGNAIAHTRAATLSEAYDSALLIPWGCSEALYLIKQQERDEGGTEYKRGWDVVLNNYRVVLGETRYAKISYPLSISNFTQIGGGSGSGAFTVWLNGPYREVENRLTVKLLHKTGTALAHEDSIVQDTTGGKEAQFGRWIALLDPLLFGADPTFPIMFWVIQGVQGDLMYLADVSQNDYEDMVEKTTPLIPLKTFDGAAFAGWA